MKMQMKIRGHFGSSRIMANDFVGANRACFENKNNMKMKEQGFGRFFERCTHVDNASLHWPSDFVVSRICIENLWR